MLSIKLLQLLSTYVALEGLNLSVKCNEKWIQLRNVFVSAHHILTSASIREANKRINFSHFSTVEFKGEPDPLRGDEPNRRVRDAARVSSFAFVSLIHEYDLTFFQSSNL